MDYLQSILLNIHVLSFDIRIFLPLKLGGQVEWLHIQTSLLSLFSLCLISLLPFYLYHDLVHKRLYIIRCTFLSCVAFHFTTSILFVNGSGSDCVLSCEIVLH